MRMVKRSHANALLLGLAAFLAVASAAAAASASPRRDERPAPGQVAPPPGGFTSQPTFGSLGLALVVFTGGTVDDLEAAARSSGASGVWVQDANGRYQLLPVGAPGFVKATFVAAFPPAGLGAPNFPQSIAVTLVAASTLPAGSVAGVLPSASDPPIPLPSSAQMSAPSAGVVWTLVAAQRLFSSTDRGTTWTGRGLPPSAVGVFGSELSFVDDHEGWLAVGGTPGTQCQQQTVALWHTIDAGASWTPLATSGIAAEQCKSSLSFTDAAHGFLVGHDPNHAPVVYRSVDGGRTWSASAALLNPAGASAAPLQPGAVRGFGQTLLLPASSIDVRGQYVFRSTDGGTTWQSIAKVDAQDGALAFVSASRWIVVSTPSTSQETTDAGTSWHAYTTTYSQAAPIPPVVVFGSPDVGYATVRGGIQRTVDGGATWSRLTTPGT